MACSNSIYGGDGITDTLATGAYQPYNDSIMPQNSADGSYDSTFYLRNKVREDIYGPGGQPSPRQEEPSTDQPVAPEIEERVKNAFN